MTVLAAAAIVAAFVVVVAALLHAVARFVSAVGESAITGTAGFEPVNPCGAGVRVLTADEWGFAWQD